MEKVVKVKCPRCGYDTEKKENKISRVVGYDEIQEALKLKGNILYIELREEYDDMIIVMEKE